jgi:hypothetical protein
MDFLRKFDYKPYAREEILDTLTEENDENLNKAEKVAIEEIVSYLASRYDTDTIFKAVLTYDPTVNNITGDLIQLLATQWDIATAYAVNNLVAYPATAPKIYISLTSNTGSTPDSNPADFTLLGDEAALFFAAVDVVAGELPTDTAKWTVGDNRSQLMIRHVIYHVLFHAFHLVNARAIPDFVSMDYENSIKFLMDVADPRKNVNPALPLIVFKENKGLDVTWGSKTKQLNDY